MKEEPRKTKFEIDVLICEPKQGPLVGGDVSEDDEERLTEILMDSVESTDQIMEEINVRQNETKRSYVFSTNDLFVITGFVADDRQSFETILKLHEVKYDEESFSNEEISEVLQQKELSGELLNEGTQSIEDDMKMKEEK